MTKFIIAAKKFIVAEEGATMVEYGVMVGLITAICIAIVSSLGKQVLNAFTMTSTNLTANGIGP